LEEAMHLSDRIIVMQAGLLEQTGTPAEIFARPTNEFVAKFVGFENLLLATVTEVRGDEIEFRFADTGDVASLPASCAGRPVAVGDSIRVAFRAANALVHDERSTGGAARLEFRGVIERVDFLGSRNEYRITSGESS